MPSAVLIILVRRLLCRSITKSNFSSRSTEISARRLPFSFPSKCSLSMCGLGASTSLKAVLVAKCSSTFGTWFFTARITGVVSTMSPIEEKRRMRIFKLYQMSGCVDEWMSGLFQLILLTIHQCFFLALKNSSKASLPNAFNVISFVKPPFLPLNTP